MSETLTLKLADGTEFQAEAYMESGKLHLHIGGWTGFSFVIEPESAKQVCKIVSELLQWASHREQFLSCDCCLCQKYGKRY